MRKNKKFAGFTLIELLVTIVVIEILATISVSTFNGYFAGAKNVKSATATKNYQNILDLYYVENGHYPIVLANTGRCLGNYGSTDTCFWNNTLRYGEDTLKAAFIDAGYDSKNEFALEGGSTANAKANSFLY